MSFRKRNGQLTALICFLGVLGGTRETCGPDKFQYAWSEKDNAQVLAIYSASLSTINFIFLLVVTVGVAVFIWRHRKQEGKASLFDRTHSKRENNSVAISVQDQASSPGFESSIPLLTSTREIIEDVSITIPPAQIVNPQVHELPRVEQSKTRSKTQFKAPEQRASDEGITATSGKVGRSLSMPRLPRRKPATEPKPSKEAKSVGQLANMMMITSELNNTDTFQRLSGESNELQQEETEQKHRKSYRGDTVQNSGGTGRGNEYQMTALVKESPRDATSKQDNSPYYHKVMQGACEVEESDTEGEVQDESCSFRDARSMSDTFGNNTKAYGFPLKMTAEKKSGAAKKRSKPKTESKTTQVTDDYEPVPQNPIVEREHRVVVAAEESGEYSKLNHREMIKKSTVHAPLEGYNHLSAPEKENVAPVLYGFDQLVPEKDNN